MGAGASATINSDEVTSLSAETGLPKATVRRLHKRFVLLDRSGDGTLGQEDLSGDFPAAPAEYTPAVRAIIGPLYRCGFEKNANNQLTFPCFLRTLRIFARGQPLQPKLLFLFQVLTGGGDRLLPDQLIPMAKAVLLPRDASEAEHANLESRARQALDEAAKSTGGERQEDQGEGIGFDQFCQWLTRHIPDLERDLCFDY